MPINTSETSPLLHHQSTSPSNKNNNSSFKIAHIAFHKPSKHPLIDDDYDYEGNRSQETTPIFTSRVQEARRQTRRFLTSKTGHYAVLLLVSLDVCCIFADFILSLYVCEHTCKNRSATSTSFVNSTFTSSTFQGPPTSFKSPDAKPDPGFGPTLHKIQTAQKYLDIISITFSSLFLLELLASLLAFGPWTYLKGSWFHCFDAAVILASFIVDVCLKGVIDDAADEVGSIIVVLRLWRVVKIIEELSAGAEERMEGLAEKLEKVSKENETLRAQLGGEGVRQRVVGGKNGVVDGNGGGNLAGDGGDV